MASTVPLSVFHCTTKDTELLGYSIPEVSALSTNCEGHWLGQGSSRSLRDECFEAKVCCLPCGFACCHWLVFSSLIRDGINMTFDGLSQDWKPVYYRSKRLEGNGPEWLFLITFSSYVSCINQTINLYLDSMQSHPEMYQSTLQNQKENQTDCLEGLRRS